MQEGLTHLYIVILDVIISNSLQECLGMVTQGPSVGAKSGLTGRSAPRRATMVLIFLFIVAIVDLAGLQASREDG